MTLDVIYSTVIRVVYYTLCVHINYTIPCYKVTINNVKKVQKRRKKKKLKAGDNKKKERKGNINTICLDLVYIGIIT